MSAHAAAAALAAAAAGAPLLLTPAEVAARFGVDRRTLARWRVAGIGPAFVRTLGGHHRYVATEVAQLLALSTTPATEEKP